MAAKKDLMHNTRQCGQVYDILYNEHNIPYLQCPCGAKIEDWVKWENTYKNLWQNSSAWEAKKDHITCLLGYFAYLYRTHYDIDFTFSLNDKGLFRGPECHLIRKVYTQFNSNPNTVKSYFEWIFETKVRQKKKRITSLAFLATPAIIQEFKLRQQKSLIISRNTPLPTKMLEWVDKFVPEVRTHVSLRDFGELHMLMTYYREGHFADIAPIAKLVKKLQDLHYVGPDLNIVNWRE